MFSSSFALEWCLFRYALPWAFLALKPDSGLHMPFRFRGSFNSLLFNFFFSFLDTLVPQLDFAVSVKS